MTREAKIEAALQTCLATSPNDAITLDEYRWWRAALTDPSSVPTALRIGRTAAAFAEACDRAEVPYNQAAFKHAARTNQRRRWTETEIADALQSCATDLERTPTIPDYKAWRLTLEQADTVPSAHLIQQRGWARNIQRAGLSRRTFLGDDEMLERLRHALVDLSPPVTQSKYDRYRSTKPELGLPSSSTLMRRTGMKWRCLTVVLGCSRS